ncbi:GNAT family N-acetyltransferase [Rhodococcoides yunnanense]|uniref:GNAT family N-acetyltransferase n=1 Tax=Rhodococcoides yunnanense TaxID=278209 RepID=A0ABU4BC68_9NOCA|nr:GNAT family N-acetyltransferase [Rhodococcus yunnanensis]MDV6261793.1 GNAT family N-acetyltransferase [Rhodococcus yunnanensis]
MKPVDVVIRSVDAKDFDDPQKLASIWVRSTALRDGSVEPTRVSSAVEGIRRRSELDGARALVAECSGDTVGFVLCAVQGDLLEIFYLAVDPEMWGRGIATRLLHAVDSHAGSVGCETCELWVIDDNERAIGVYEGAGWLRTDLTQTDAASGRLERRLLRRTPDSRDHARSR